MYSNFHSYLLCRTLSTVYVCMYERERERVCAHFQMCLHLFFGITQASASPQPQLSDSTMREGFLHRTFLMRDGRKVRKNWTNSYTRYIVHSFDSECSGILYFSKNKDDEKVCKWLLVYWYQTKVAGGRYIPWDYT